MNAILESMIMCRVLPTCVAFCAVCSKQLYSIRIFVWLAPDGQKTSVRNATIAQQRMQSPFYTDSSALAKLVVPIGQAPCTQNN